MILVRQAMLPLIVLSVLVPGRWSSRQSCGEKSVVAFVGTDVLTMTDSILLRAQNVVVRNGLIESVGTRSIPNDACRIDARGKVLMPGLADMHVHTSSREMPLFLANGVTLVREMNGSPRHLALRDSIAAGTLPGPRLLVASTLLTGQKWPVRYRLIERVDSARAAAREIKAAGYDFLKIYDGLSLEVYNTFVDEGKALGIPLDGHIPRAVGLERVLAAGQTLEHLDKITVAVAGHPPEMAKLEDARRIFTGKSTWVTPTLASLRALDRAGSTEYAAGLQKPEMTYVDSASMGWWRSLAGSGTRQATASPMYQFEVGLLRVLRETGTQLLAGTDAANPLMVAGFSLHEELRVLVEDGGMSRYEALVSATRNPARFLGDTLGGTVRVGARADLILVDGNPLNDLTPLRRPAGVMVGGRWLDRARLDALLASAKTP